MVESHNHCIFVGVYPEGKGNKEKKKERGWDKEGH